MQDDNTRPEDILPRTKRRRNRSKQDRGLAPDDELRKLATIYLEHQHKHWPNLVKARLLPPISTVVVEEMVEDFRARHRTGVVDVARFAPYLMHVPKVAGTYMRYSCDQSDPVSIIDQLTNCLDRAREEDRFVPWAYVFADYSVTGLDFSRQGYTGYKALIGHKDHLIETTYIDDFSRASRDEVEWWLLAWICRRANTRMIGASDDFDLHSPDADLKLSLYSLFSRLFKKQLCEKVTRGMRGAISRGGILGKPGLGFTRKVMRDTNGNILHKPNGRPKHAYCIDPVTKGIVLEIYDLFVNQNWSTDKIAKDFNARRVDNWDGWGHTTIDDILFNAVYVGVFIWGRTRRVFNPETRKWEILPNPRQNWRVRYDPRLGFVPRELWKAARRRLAMAHRTSPLTGRPYTRNEMYATTLFSGTLECGYCERELTLIRSTQPYKDMGCWHGTQGRFGCKLTSSKSTRIIEESLLGYIRTYLFTEANITKLVTLSNKYLAEEAAKPKRDVEPLRNRAKSLEASIAKLVRLIESEPDASLVTSYDTRVKHLQKDLNAVREECCRTEKENAGPPTPLDPARVGHYLNDLRAVLNQEIPV